MSNTLHARRLNHGQCEIWLDDESKSRTIATNAVFWAVKWHCGKDEANTLWDSLHVSMGNVAEVFAAGTIVEELGLAR